MNFLLKQLKILIGRGGWGSRCALTQDLERWTNVAPSPRFIFPTLERVVYVLCYVSLSSVYVCNRGRGGVPSLSRCVCTYERVIEKGGGEF